MRVCVVRMYICIYVCVDVCLHVLCVLHGCVVQLIDGNPQMPPPRFPHPFYPYLHRSDLPCLSFNWRLAWQGQLDETIDPLGDLVMVAKGCRAGRRQRTGQPGVFVQGLGKTWPCRETTLSDVWEAAVVFFFLVWIGVVAKGGGGTMSQIDDMGPICHRRYSSPSHPPLPSVSLTCSFSLLSFFRAEGEGGISANWGGIFLITSNIPIFFVLSAVVVDARAWAWAKSHKKTKERGTGRWGGVLTDRQLRESVLSRGWMFTTTNNKRGKQWLGALLSLRPRFFSVCWPKSYTQT